MEIPDHDTLIPHIDTTPAEVDAAYRCDTSSWSATSLRGLWAINERLGDEHRKADVPSTPTSAGRLVQELTVESAEDDGFPMKPQRILHDLRQRWTTTTSSSATSAPTKMWTARHYPPTSRTPYHLQRFCSMAGRWAPSPPSSSTLTGGSASRATAVS